MKIEFKITCSDFNYDLPANPKMCPLSYHIYKSSLA